MECLHAVVTFYITSIAKRRNKNIIIGTTVRFGCDEETKNLKVPIVLSYVCTQLWASVFLSFFRAGSTNPTCALVSMKIERFRAVAVVVGAAPASFSSLSLAFSLAYTLPFDYIWSTAMCAADISDGEQLWWNVWWSSWMYKTFLVMKTAAVWGWIDSLTPCEFVHWNWFCGLNRRKLLGVWKLRWLFSQFQTLPPLNQASVQLRRATSSKSSRMENFALVIALQPSCNVVK